MTVAGLILAGGQSRRMGREKAFLPLGGRLMIERVIDRLVPQVDRLAINANGDPARFSALGLPILQDDLPDTGPLGGVLAGLLWAESLAPAPDYLATVPVDSPFIPADLVQRLEAASRENPGGVVIAASGERDHPVVGLWPVGLSGTLADWRRSAKSHGVRSFLATIGFTVVDFPFLVSALDPFLNVNTPEEHARAEGLLAAEAHL
ncbi:molybdenum cofactor guanylyltransferase [Kaistia algarum]|uniref:molybdenum cofactor guanylyltransferase MobA n=1 Tax=Kaistia algarum TaxID=2083279 RepID=UPI000CE9000E|nr:molybdenum cofactor guanylyltransferase MobA [Kaistia algarum]MCX5514666.1 molybdenum cofactor guanylyltransferase [Kaistia algarum]PPE78904.1 molybdenum cofactor guanylyltransferase [Kaistia algarum]